MGDGARSNTNRETCVACKDCLHFRMMEVEEEEHTNLDLVLGIAHNIHHPDLVLLHFDKLAHTEYDEEDLEEGHANPLDNNTSHYSEDLPAWNDTQISHDLDLNILQLDENDKSIPNLVTMDAEVDWSSQIPVDLVANIHSHIHHYNDCILHNTILSPVLVHALHAPFLFQLLANVEDTNEKNHRVPNSDSCEVWEDESSNAVVVVAHHDNFHHSVVAPPHS